MAKAFLGMGAIMLMAGLWSGLDYHFIATSPCLDPCAPRLHAWAVMLAVGVIETLCWVGLFYIGKRKKNDR